MTVFATAIDAIHDAVQAFALEQDVPCAYPNARFTAPRTAAGRDLPWMRLAMPAGEIAPEMLFQPARPVMRGFFTLSFFAPFDSGAETARDLLDAALTTFAAGASIGTAAVVTRHSQQAVAAAPDWWQINLTVFFRAQ